MRRTRTERGEERDITAEDIEASAGNDRQTEDTTENMEETEAQFQTRVVREITRDKKWEQRYGDERDHASEVEEHIVRIMTYNIGTFPKRGTIKQDLLKRDVRNNQITGMSELNQNWTKLPSMEAFRERTEGWFKNPRTQVAWLCDPHWPSTHQKGGVSLTIQGHLTPFVQEKGTDKDGLGRWAWYTLEGRSHIKTAVIQIYRPCNNKQDIGSTYAQQQAWTDHTNPLEKFDKDLMVLIDDLRNQGFQIIIMGDINQTLVIEERGIERQLKDRGIIDHIRERYGKEVAPNTHYRGSRPIDAIFGSETLEMIRGGYDPGQPGISDHRSIWGEFTLDSILGEDRGAFEKPRTRKLQIKNKKVTKRYNQAFERQISIHRLLEKGEQLMEEVGSSGLLNEEQCIAYERLDAQLQRAIQHSNEKCAKTPSDETPFSPTYQRALGKANLWAEVLRRMKTRGYVNMRWIIRMKKRWDIKETFTIPKTIAKVRQSLREAKAQLKEVKQQAPELREDFLDMKIRLAEDEGNEKMAKEIRRIRDGERIRKAHTRIKAAQGKLKGGGVKFVERELPDGSRATIKDKTEMEAEIMKANEEKLHSANESPLRQGELGTLITDGDYEQWERFLQGELTLPPGMDEGTRLWLNAIIQMPEEDVEIDITTKKYINSWKKPKEHTACAPGPMHFGTFKAMQWNEAAAKLHTIMATIPIKTGYTPKRWAQCIDSMLPKKKDDWRPGKLRLTALLPPDFNHNNKILGREAMASAEAKSQLAPEQYGSRKRLSAAKHALNKRLLLDILRLQRRSGVVCANDAKSCYDRILHFAAYVSLRRAGLTRQATTSMLTPIKHLLHRIRTAYGDSKETYGGDNWDRDPSGICQGNGAGPAIWALVSSPLLKIVREAGFGAKLHGAIGTTYIHLAGFAFVDDADTFQTGEHSEHIDEIVHKAQAQLTLWEQAIKATGGGIEGSKSDFAVIDFEWTEGQWQYKQKNREHRLSVPAPDGTRTQLKQTDATEARRTLGVWQAPDGNESEQTKQMKDKATQWSNNIRKGFLSRADIQFGVQTSLYPSITYGLMATALTAEQGADVFKPVRANVLGPMGYNRTIPATVVHGPVKYGGMGIKDIYTIQGTEHLKVLLDETRGNSPTAGLLQIAHQDHILEIGRDRFLYDWKFSEVAHLMTETWVKNTLKFISDTNLKVEGDLPRLHTWRDGDTMLMDEFETTQGHTINKQDLIRANRCRQYLQVLTRADIASGNGTKILQSAWKVEKDWTSCSANAYRWPKQPRPSQQDIKAWQRVLQARYGVDKHHLGWTRPLGSFLHHAHSQISWRFDRVDESIYQRTAAGWRRWTRIIQRERSVGYRPTQEYTEQIRQNTHPAVVTTPTRREVAYLEGYDRHSIHMEDTDERPEENETHTLAAAIGNIHPSLRWVLYDCELPADDGEEIARQLQRGTLHLACDGSLKEDRGTAAGITKDLHDEASYQFWTLVPGTKEEQTSYRSEICGILGHILLITTIAKYHGVNQGTATIGCDNESALWAALGKQTVNTGEPCHDLLRVIHHHTNGSNIQWKRHHVYGHQDEHKAKETLDSWALANIRTDHMADDHWMIHYQDRGIPPIHRRMEGEGWRVSIGDNPIIAHFEDKIYEQRYKKQCIGYWKKKGRILENTEDNIDWPLYAEATKITPRSKRQWTHKHFSGFEGTNYMLHKCGERDDPTCPMCDQIEKHTHILQCQAPPATATYDKLSNEYYGWLHRTTTPSMAEAILEILEAYRHNRNIVVQERWADDVRLAVQVQCHLGTRPFVEGFMHKRWEGIQASYLASIQSRKSPRRWMRQLILKTWMVSWDMWDARNGRVHNLETQHNPIVAALHTEIRAIHQIGHQQRLLPRAARIFFQEPIEKILEKTTYQKRVWTRLGNKYLENDNKQMRQNGEAARMREWLIPGSTQGRRRVRSRNNQHGALEPGTPGGAGIQEPRHTQDVQDILE